MIEIRGAVELPALRENITLVTDDGLALVGELSLPERAPAAASLITLHPLPTEGGFMDSHIIRKAAARLPALADVAVLRFNTRGTSSPRGVSEGSFDEGIGEMYDVAAAVSFAEARELPRRWILGWSFGTELALKYGHRHDVEGIILLSPPLHRTTSEELAAWADIGIPVIVVVPEHDTFLAPAEAAKRFAAIPHATLIPITGGKHLWVGETMTRIVLNEIVRAVNPSAFPLPTEWSATARSSGAQSPDGR